MTDHYIKNPEALKGQPKRTIADYVEQNGILVPRRFDSLAEARRSKKAILLRSEHPQEYDGVSGLLDSFRLSEVLLEAHGRRQSIAFSARGLKSRLKIRENYFKFLRRGYNGVSRFERFCDLSRIDKSKFEKEVSFSAWEYLPGVNHTVVADSAIPERHHILTLGEKEGIKTYYVVEKQKIIHDWRTTLSNKYKPDLSQLIELYEHIRNLDRFNSNHCPIMEFQTSDGKNYFLQYHRARDSQHSDFILHRDPQKEEIDVSFVRGCTGPEGMNCKVTVHYSGKSEMNYDIENEDGSFDLHYHKIFSQINTKKRKIQIISGELLQTKMLSFIEGHQCISKLFKPQVSIIHNLSELISEKEMLANYEKIRKGKNSHINVHIISDGRKAYIQRI